MLIPHAQQEGDTDTNPFLFVSFPCCWGWAGRGECLCYSPHLLGFKLILLSDFGPAPTLLCFVCSFSFCFSLHFFLERQFYVITESVRRTGQSADIHKQRAWCSIQSFCKRESAKVTSKCYTSHFVAWEARGNILFALLQSLGAHSMSTTQEKMVKR